MTSSIPALEMHVWVNTRIAIAKACILKYPRERSLEGDELGINDQYLRARETMREGKKNSGSVWGRNIYLLSTKL